MGNFSGARLLRILVVALILCFVLQAFLAACQDSVTIDEFLHLPLGYYIWQTGDFTLDPINPPLARLVWALPLLIKQPNLSSAPTTDAWGIGTDFMYSNQERYQTLFVDSRLLVIGVATLLLILIYHWSKQAFGSQAALAALFIGCFSPDFLAHGHLVTTDILATMMFTLTLYTLWLFRNSSSLRFALLVGLTFGLAILVKFSCLILVVPICLVVISLNLRRTWLQLLTILISTLVIINLGYAAHGIFTALRDISFVSSGTLSSIATSLPWLALPLPSPFLQGIDRILEEGALNINHAYLFGQTSTAGWWYYHLVAFLVKSPIPMILLFVASIFTFLNERKRPERSDGLYLIFSIALVFLFNALLNSQQIGVRHLLLAYPSIYMLSGVALSRIFCPQKCGSQLNVLLRNCIGVGFVLWLAIETVANSPRFLQYFNDFAGGSDNGHKVLIDSNIDWGQDLIRLRQYMDRNSINSIKLAYFGKVNPKIYGIKFSPLELDSKGVAVISASFLMGRPFWWYRQGVMQLIPANYYSKFREQQPIGRVGAFFVYDLK